MFLCGDFIPQKFIPNCDGFVSDEFVLANLEGPICLESSKIKKAGIHLHSNPFDIDGKWCFSLANNHLMDYREFGLVETLKFLDQKGFKYAGAGLDLLSARTPCFFMENGKKIAVISCCERQFGIADNSRSGVAEKGEWVFDVVNDLRSDISVDYIIVSCHIASEYSPFISPKVRDFYHRLIDAGVSIIHGHHSHVPQGIEKYKDGLITYGLGNFVVDPNCWKGNNQFWSRVIRVEFGDTGLIIHNPLIYVCEIENGFVRAIVADEKIKKDLITYCDIIDKQCSDDNLCLALWQESCVRLYPRIYEQNLRAPSILRSHLSYRDSLRKLYFVFVELKKIIFRKEFPTEKSKFYGLCLYNAFACETHVDVISTALGVLLEQVEDLRSSQTKYMADICRI